MSLCMGMKHGMWITHCSGVEITVVVIVEEVHFMRGVDTALEDQVEKDKDHRKSPTHSQCVRDH